MEQKRIKNEIRNIINTNILFENKKGIIVLTKLFFLINLMYNRLMQ